jgi:tRNA(fMet)-specific endonuclease VapC
VALNLAIDANCYSDFVRGSLDAVAVFARATCIAMPVIVVAELRAGFRGGTRNAENEQRLTEFLQEDGVWVLFPDLSTTHYYADAYHQLRQAGTPIPTNDLWIAALVLQHDLVLFSRDKHFDRIARLPRV